jgi:hypothetical protein
MVSFLAFDLGKPTISGRPITLRKLTVSYGSDVRAATTRTVPLIRCQYQFSIIIKYMYDYCQQPASHVKARNRAQLLASGRVRLFLAFLGRGGTRDDRTGRPDAGSTGWL